MTTTRPDFSVTPVDLREYSPIVERGMHPRRIESREEFRRWLKRVLVNSSEMRRGPSGGGTPGSPPPQIWECVVDGVERFCPECRKELGETAPAIVQTAAAGGETSKSWDELRARLRTLYDLTASPVEADADRLARYLRNFTSSGHKAMICELWTKGFASYQRLANLRGKYGVTANADRIAIERLVAKAESLRTPEWPIRITKGPSGLTLEKRESDRNGTEALLPPVNPLH